MLLCEGMKLAINKHFAAFEMLEDGVASILCDFKTTAPDLLQRMRQDTRLCQDQLE